MSLQTVNDCIVIPNLPNWGEKVRVRRSFQTRIASGVRGSENRSAGRTAPLRRMEWQVIADTPEDRARLTGRISAALRTGRAAVANWGRQQRVDGEIDGSFCGTLGLWDWSPGDIALFVRPGGGEQIDHLVNCGGTAAGSYVSDRMFTGGSEVTTSSAQDLLHLVDSGLPVPPAAVYQSCRAYSGASPGSIVYTITGLQPNVPCRVRIHAAEIEPGFDRSEHMRLTDYEVRGLTAWTASAFEPYYVANGQLNTAPNWHLDCTVIPAADGSATITASCARREVVALATDPVDMLTVTEIDGVAIAAGQLVALTGQTDSTTNGIWYRAPAGTVHRADWAASAVGLRAVVFYVTGGTNAGWWTNTNDAEFVLGTDGVTFAQYEGNPYHCSITAVELYQHAWDAVVLDEFTTGQHLSWIASGLLPGVYDDCDVYPVICGKLICESMRALTDWVGRVDLAIQEPLGTGTQATPGACPVEICSWDRPSIDPPPPVDCGGGKVRYDDFQSEMGILGNSTPHPSTYWYAANYFALVKAEFNFLNGSRGPTNVNFFWQYFGANNIVNFNIEFVRRQYEGTGVTPASETNFYFEEKNPTNGFWAVCAHYCA